MFWEGIEWKVMNFPDKFLTDNGQFEEGGVASKADRLRQAYQTVWHAFESQELGLLLPICQG